MARKILLADDSVTAQNMGRKILADAGYEVLTVNNGSAALKRINEIKPDLIILDVYMPGYSGLEVCQRLKEAAETAHIPVLLTVGKLEPFKPDEARRVRADAHIVKPFEASELLSALAMLEDRMVAHGAGSKFGSGEGQGTTESGDLDSGWKNRLRFPSRKKKKEEPAAETEELAGTFRDFRKGKKKTTASAASAKPQSQEPAVVPDIPRDITPEELDALSALAAKLDAPIPEAEKIAEFAAKAGAPAESAAVGAEAIAETVEAASTLEEKFAVPVAEVASEPAATIPTEAPETAAPETSAAEATFAVTAAAETPAIETTDVEPAVEPKEFEVPPPPVEASEPATASASVFEIPVEHVEPPSESAPAGQQGQVETSQTVEANALTLVSATSFAEAPAPVDQQDEPIFASAPAEQQVETEPSEAVASNEISAPAAEAVAKTEESGTETPKPEEVGAAELKTDEPKAEETTAAVAKAEESATEAMAESKPESKPEDPVAAEVNVAEVLATEPVSTEVAAPAEVASSAIEPVAAHEVEPEGPVPSEEELAEALRLLTPSTGLSAASIPSQGTLVAAGQLLAEEAARHASANSRWIAVPVALASEEAAISLEEEMFRAFAAPVAAISATTVGASTATQAANSDSESEKEQSDALAALTVAAAPVAAAEIAASADQEDPAVQAADAVIQQLAAAGFAGEPAHVAEVQVVGEQSPAAQFPAVQANSETPSVTQAIAEPAQVAAIETSVEAPASAAPEANQESTSESGGQEDMAKDGKGKSGKSQWREIHAPVSAASKGDAVESAKQTDDAPKAMAAAAAAESAASSQAAPDPSAIANIVDSVLADLRPKIVEEIAKKLSGK